MPAEEPATLVILPCDLDDADLAWKPDVPTEIYDPESELVIGLASFQETPLRDFVRCSVHGLERIPSRGSILVEIGQTLVEFGSLLAPRTLLLGPNEYDLDKVISVESSGNEEQDRDFCWLRTNGARFTVPVRYETARRIWTFTLELRERLK